MQNEAVHKNEQQKKIEKAVWSETDADPLLELRDMLNYSNDIRISNIIVEWTKELFVKTKK